MDNHAAHSGRVAFWVSDLLTLWLPDHLKPCTTTSLLACALTVTTLLAGNPVAASKERSDKTNPPSVNPVFREPNALDQWLQQAADKLLIENPRTPGIAIALVREGEVIASAAAGYADPAPQTPMNANTPLRIASVTKIYVAATLLAIAERRNISVATPIKELLPEKLQAPLRGAGYDLSTITLSHLLSHTSGMRQHSDSRWYHFRSLVLRYPVRHWQVIDTIELLAQQGPPIARPGERYRYSDTGYILLGQIIEQLTNKPLHQAVRETLNLDALPLSATWWEHFEQAPKGAPALAELYYHNLPINGVDASFDLYGGGGLIATTADMATFLYALFNGEMLSRDARERMTTGSQTPEDSTYRYGLNALQWRDGTYYGHSGMWGAQALYFPTHAMAIAGVVTRNTSRHALHKLLLDAAIYYRELVSTDKGVTP